MSWFKVDDSFYDHPKVFDAPDCALALWIRAGCWSARNLQNGFVPSTMPARLCDDPDTAVRELLRRGLWLRKPGGYQFHDWNEYQPSADQVKDLRAKRADAGRKGGLSKAAKQTASNDLANARPDAKQNAAPARPGPSPISGTAGGVPQPPRPSTGTSPPVDNQEPQRQCPAHADDPDPPNCGACADARRRHGRWQAADTQRRRTAPHCRIHRGQPAYHCGLCRSEQLATA